MSWTSYPPTSAGPGASPRPAACASFRSPSLLLFILWREFPPAAAAVARLGMADLVSRAYLVARIGFLPELRLVALSSLARRPTGARGPLRAAVLAGIEIIIVAAALVGASSRVLLSALRRLPELRRLRRLCRQPDRPAAAQPARIDLVLRLRDGRRHRRGGAARQEQGGEHANLRACSSAFSRCSRCSPITSAAATTTTS